MSAVSLARDPISAAIADVRREVADLRGVQLAAFEEQLLKAPRYQRSRKWLKGYVLVGCSLTGVNALFVREDLSGDLFDAPFTAEHHFEPARYFLVRRTGFPRLFGFGA